VEITTVSSERKSIGISAKLQDGSEAMYKDALHRSTQVKQTVLLSGTWDSRPRTRTWCPRTRTWKLVLGNPRGQGFSSRTMHRVSNKRF